MKNIINIVSWISFIVIVIAITLASVYVGAIAAGWVENLLQLQGWHVLFVTPVLLVVALAVAFTLMLGCLHFKTDVAGDC